MALNNNALYNAAYLGCMQGIIGGKWHRSTVAADFLKQTQAAQAFATEVDSLIPFDALITTNASNTMLVNSGSNTIQSNTYFRPVLLQSICQANFFDRYSQDPTAADFLAIAKACVALYTEALLLLVSP